MTPAAHRAEEPTTITVRQLPQMARGLPRWEVLCGSEATGWQIIGWIEEKHLRGAKNPFYFATGIHPGNGGAYRLEGSIDFDERVNTIADFHIDPNTSRQHLWQDAVHQAPAARPQGM